MNKEFSKEELELLAYGFGFYVQGFPLPEDDPAHELLDKLYRLIDEASEFEASEARLK